MGKKLTKKERKREMVYFLWRVSLKKKKKTAGEER